MRIDVTLHGDRAEQFQRIKDDLQKRMDNEPDRPEVVGYLMANFETDSEDEQLIP